VPYFTDRVKVSTATAGTGTITLGAAAQAQFRSFTAAGVPNGSDIRYLIEDGTAWEIGLGTYNSAAGTLTRGPVLSSNANAAIPLSGNATVAIAPTAIDFNAKADKDSPSFTGNIDFLTSPMELRQAGHKFLKVENVPAEGPGGAFQRLTFSGCWVAPDTSVGAFIWGHALGSRNPFGAKLFLDDERPALGLVTTIGEASYPGATLTLEQSGAAPTMADQVIAAVVALGKFDINAGDNPSPAYMAMVSAGAWANGSTPMDIVFGATPSGSEAPVERFRFRGSGGAKGTGPLEITGPLSTFYPGGMGGPVGLKGAKYKSVRGSNLGATTTDLYTVPAGKRAVISVSMHHNTNAAACTIQQMLKAASVYYPLGGQVSVAAGGINSNGSFLYVFEAGESWAITTSVSGLNLWGRIVEFDNDAPLKSGRVLTLLNGDNLLYTAPAGKTVYVQGGIWLPPAQAPSMNIINASGATRTFSSFGTAAGVTASSTGARVHNGVAIANNAIGFCVVPPNLGAGESIVFTSDGAGAGVAYVTVWEQPE
jgi:hypothetical protein